MNIFLPNEDNIGESVKALDDVRLQKQAVEIYQLLTLAIKEQQEGKEVKAGHYHHPVYLFYKDNIKFLDFYGMMCCFEYFYRFGKSHKLTDAFGKYAGEVRDLGNGYCLFDLWAEPDYTPYYMEGSKGQPNYIRTTENVSALFQAKLCKKWNADKSKGREPRWTNRDVPQFYKTELTHQHEDKLYCK